MKNGKRASAHNEAGALFLLRVYPKYAKICEGM